MSMCSVVKIYMKNVTPSIHGYDDVFSKAAVKAMYK